MRSWRSVASAADCATELPLESLYSSSLWVGLRAWDFPSIGPSRESPPGSPIIIRAAADARRHVGGMRTGRGRIFIARASGRSPSLVILCLRIQLYLLSVFNLIMLDSWIDEVHESASWLCIFFLSPLLSLGSSDRSHNGHVGMRLVIDLELHHCALVRHWGYWFDYFNKKVPFGFDLNFLLFAICGVYVWIYDRMDWIENTFLFR
jgi:hypothetical protein